MNDYEHLRLCAARYVWPRRSKRTPKGMKWPQWWESKFDQDYYLFVARMREEKKASKLLSARFK